MQLGIHISLHRDVMGPSFAPAEIHLRYGPPADAQRYGAAFGCPVLLGQSDNRLFFDATWLSDTAQLGNQITNSLVLRLCDELLDDFQLRTGVSGKVRDALVPALDRPKRLDAVARDLKMSPRTLRRRLQEERKTFQGVLDELRMYVAVPRAFAPERAGRAPQQFAVIGRQAKGAIRRTLVISLPASRMRATASASGSIATAI